MAQPSSRAELKEYCLKQLGKPVLEINVDDDQIDNLIDDAIQYFHERHYDGIERVYLKHKITPTEKETIKQTGISTTQSATVVGAGLTSIDYVEGVNYLPLPDSIIGVNSVLKLNSSTVSDGLFNIKYQLFLNDVYYYGALDLLNYSMVKRYLEDLDHILNPHAMIRFNKTNHKLYLDIDWTEVGQNEYLIIDCYRIINPSEATKVYNDFWLKRYLTALIKKQWGMNMIKFNGVQLPGGVVLNGRQIYEDGLAEIEKLEEQLKNEYELPPIDLIG
jgi:hypothetical protein|tara:strand:+ start:490 stop:1314 length:825 start_codon:yes stop_codon:yes gene_type:complete